MSMSITQQVFETGNLRPALIVIQNSTSSLFATGCFAVRALLAYFSHTALPQQIKGVMALNTAAWRAQRLKSKEKRGTGTELKEPQSYV